MNSSRYAAVMSTVAVALALTMGGAYATGVVVGSKQIKNGSVKSVDLRNGGVHGSDIGENQVDGSDIAANQVSPEDVAFPTPRQCQVTGATQLSPTLEFQKIATVCDYTKVANDSVLEVDWTGAVRGNNGGEAGGCLFQIRVDGVPSSQGGGEVFGKGITAVSAAAYFPGVASGPHDVEIWAKVNIDTDAGNLCVLGPETAGMNQTIDVGEQPV